MFVATSSWQEVRPGQRVPGGLHVRLNLETGKKEARLLAPEAGEGEAATTSEVQVVPQIDPSVPQPVVQSRRRPLLGPSPG